MMETLQPSPRILGVRVDDVTLMNACDRVAKWIAEGGVHQIATVNPEFIMASRRDREFAGVLERSELNVPDGVGVLWASRRVGRPLRERVAGVELMQRLCALGSQYKWRAFFLGAREGVAERTAANLAFLYQGLAVAGTYAGSPRAEDEPAICDRIQRTHPNLLFVAYGAPAQDKWLARNLPVLASSYSSSATGLVGMGVGGAFDYITGVQKRAPQRWQALGLEWLYRLLREPRRLKRQLALVQFAFAVMLKSI